MRRLFQQLILLGSLDAAKTFMFSQGNLRPQRVASLMHFSPTTVPHASHFADICLNQTVAKTAKNIATVLNLSEKGVMDNILLTDQRVVDIIEEWRGVDCGSDLFIKGMGGFHAGEAHERCVKRNMYYRRCSILSELTVKGIRQVAKDVFNLKRHKATKDELIDLVASNWKEPETDLYLFKKIVDTQELPLPQSYNGISFPEFELKLFKNDTWYANPDEVRIEGYFGENLEETGDRHIRRCLRVSRRFRNGEPHFWPDDWKKKSPSQLLGALRRHEMKLTNFPNTKFTHLDNLLSRGKPRVLRSSEDVWHAAQDLRNCAFNYVDKVERESAILVVLDHDKRKDKAIALGMIGHDRSSVNSKWSQIYLACNQRPPLEVVDAFHGFTSDIKNWARVQYEE